MLALLASCVAPRQAPPSGPPPRPPPVAAPPPVVSDDWHDIALAPGGWTYAPEAGGSAARFGPPGAASFVARCDAATRSLTLSREGAAAASAPLIDITTSAGRRSFAGQPLAGATLAATLPARDPFLDKMAFSRGRFVVAVTGTARLAIPARPEFARVVEDCRG